MNATLSKEAQAVLNAYAHLQIGGITIPCLYYNNKTNNIRAGLRVSIGKGSPKEILEEIHILAMKEHLDLEAADEKVIRIFLQKHHIGVDCSALAYYTLHAEVYARTGKQLRRILKYPLIKNPIRKLLTKLRNVENTNVQTLAHDSNSRVIPLPQVQAGDMITILEGGRENNFYHVMIIHKVSGTNHVEAIHYTHSLRWSTDGVTHHGVRTGTITILDPTQDILAQQWEEQGCTEDKNETFVKARLARTVTIRRLHILDTK